MSAEPRIKRLERLLGGMENMPRELVRVPPSPNTETPEPMEELVDHSSQLPAVEPFIAANPVHIEQAIATPQHVKHSMAHPAHPKQTTTDIITEEHLKLQPRFGEVAPIGLSFVPFSAVTRFPYKFLGRHYLQPVATAFFDQEKIWNRQWDLYYIWSDHAPTAKPVDFVPQHQFQALLKEINKAFPNLQWAISEENRAEGFVLTFDDPNPDLRPRFLGQSNSRIQRDTWLCQVPHPSDVEMLSVPEDHSVEPFKLQVELAREYSRNKSKAGRSKKIEEVMVKRQEMTKQVLRAQRYLGLAAKQDDSLLLEIGSLMLAPLDVTKPSPHPFDSEPIFIAIDVESYERNHGAITEVGVATLDTRDLLNQPPGRVGEDWQKLIRARHFRVKENKDYMNRDFIHGCPDRFEFGTSEMVEIKSMASKLTSCFHEPFSRTPGKDAKTCSKPGDSANDDNPGKRNIILLGHDVMQDVNYCHQLGFSVTNCCNLLEIMDTSAMYRAYIRDPSAKSLGGILCDFDLSGWHLHNAGNDAVYTIWAMLAICVTDAAEKGSSEAEKRRQGDADKRTEAAVEQAKEKAQEDSEGWASPDGEDGGVAVSPYKTVSGGNRKPKRGPASGAGHQTGYGLYTLAGAPLDV